MICIFLKEPLNLLFHLVSDVLAAYLGKRMLFPIQLVIISLSCLALGILTFALARLRNLGLIHFVSSVLLGILCGLIGTHLWGGTQKVEGWEWAYLASFAVGIITNKVLSRFLGHGAYRPAHKSTLRFTSVLPHSFFDGCVWGLSLGFSPSLSSSVFIFLLLHRSVETLSWMGVFSDLSARKYFILLMIFIVCFGMGASAGSWIGTVSPEQRRYVFLLFALSLGYLFMAVLSELREQWIQYSRIRRRLWAALFIAGLAATLLVGQFPFT